MNCQGISRCLDSGHPVFTVQQNSIRCNVGSLSNCITFLLEFQVKKPAVKKTSKIPAKGAGKGVGAGGSKKKKSTLKYTVDCTHPVEDGIMDPGNFVRVYGVKIC